MSRTQVPEHWLRLSEFVHPHQLTVAKPSRRERLLAWLQLNKGQGQHVLNDQTLKAINRHFLKDGSQPYAHPYTVHKADAATEATEVAVQATAEAEQTAEEARVSTLADRAVQYALEKGWLQPPVAGVSNVANVIVLVVDPAEL